MESALAQQHDQVAYFNSTTRRNNLAIERVQARSFMLLHYQRMVLVEFGLKFNLIKLEQFVNCCVSFLRCSVAQKSN
jgi:hypothetical protein